jgi:hypothetical protein
MYVCIRIFDPCVPLADGKFEAIMDAFETKTRAGYLRIIVVNPLCGRLPKLCLLVQVRVCVSVTAVI